MIRILMLCGAALIAAPATAQTTSPADAPSTPLPYDPGHDGTNARSDAIAAETAPGTAAANAEVAQQTPRTAVDTAQYSRDLAAYREAVRARADVITADAALQSDRERAYAMAMADWRTQVEACKRGHPRACDMPSPNPADYM